MYSILCFGDSNTYGMVPLENGRLPYGQRWPGRLAAMLGPEYLIIEEGMIGRTCAIDDDIKPGRNAMEYIYPCLMSHFPLDLIIVMLGTNDVKSRYRLTAGEIQMAMRVLLHKIDDVMRWMSTDAEILLVAPVPLQENMPPDCELDAASVQKTKELAELYRELAEERNIHFADAAAWVDPRNTQPDACHYDAEGCRQFAEGIHPVILDILKDKKPHHA
ncbi:MAG TPA: GDSL-type esterase/lipase family protein [Bacillota bacterium]|nr:GDSL-type esterase/lipase family protein [Bacillota bacterium]